MDKLFDSAKRLVEEPTEENWRQLRNAVESVERRRLKTKLRVRKHRCNARAVTPKPLSTPEALLVTPEEYAEALELLQKENLV